MAEHIDSEWVRSLKLNDSQVVEDLWDLLYSYGVRVARYYHQLDDVGYDGAVKAFERIRARGLEQYKFRSTFPAYCRTILVNEIRGRLSRKSFIESEPTEDIPDGSDQAVFVDPDQIRAILAPCLEKLPAREREVVEQAYFQDLSPQTVADRLGISRNFVNVIAYRARRSLQKCLENRGYITAEDVVSGLHETSH
jgi:RNA polymerase sigma-70 factor, ECF subfamily